MESGLHVGKVVEITAASTKSFEDAIAVGIDRASKTFCDRLVAGTNPKRKE
ncbi:MAG: dodecin family protein [Deltaproteobacteria bacterium]|nr:dodecin family protein [Deltaproteobacteria bacterium]